MNDQWELKRERLPPCRWTAVEHLRAAALEAGAGGVMLMGAGGGGFLLAYAADPRPVRAAMAAVGAPELTFGVDEHGCVSE